jgi:type VI secretion system ImpC/EvpB family protein
VSLGPTDTTAPPQTGRAVGGGTPESPNGSMLDAVVKSTLAARADAVSPVEAFLKARTTEQALAAWFRMNAVDPAGLSKDRIVRLLNRDVARIDALLTRQVNVILHQPKFQKLEARWRGLQYLVESLEDGVNMQVRVLDCDWRTMLRDLDKAIEFDQSQLFKRVYSEEFGNPGGEPYAVLLGDYEIRPGIAPGCPIDDLQALRYLSQVAAAAFAPFVTGVHPTMFGLNDFTDLQRSMDLAAIFRQQEYTRWRSLRQSEDARFVGLVMPHILLRAPYDDLRKRVSGFRFKETTNSRDDYLWGNAVYAFGAVLARAFAQSGWLADIRGVRQDLEEGGLVTGLPAVPYGVDRKHPPTKCSTDVIISDTLEKDLAELGFISLCHCKYTEYSAFYSNSSIQDPKAYDREVATANARLSAMLQYILCVSRLAHYLKVMGRDKVGSFIESHDCEAYLNSWLQKYITQDDEATSDMKARFPLRDASAQVRELPGKPGSYGCVIHLQPHYQLDGMVSAVRLTTELAPASR